MNHRARGLSASAFLVAGLLAAGFVVTAPASALGQAPEAMIPFEGTQAFRRFVLHDLFKLKPVLTLQEIAQSPKDTLVIVFGQVTRLQEISWIMGGLDAFQKRGGALLIASDRPDYGALGQLGAGLDGRLVHQKADSAYRDKVECPRITDFTNPRHPLFEGITQGIATNQPSYLHPGKKLLPALAVFSRDCWIQSGVTRFELFEPPIFIAASTNDQGPGRVVVIAGHGVFMNGMMAQRDNDNFTFACNCIRWLTDGGKRQRVLLLEEGTVQREFEVPLKELPMPPMPPAHMLNKVLRGLEEERFFDRVLLRLFSRERIVAAVLLVLSVVLLLYGASRLMRARYRHEPAVPLVAAGPLALADGDLPVMTQRYRDVVCGGNLWEAARALARSSFDAPAAVMPGHAAKAPPVAVAGGWRQRRTLGRQVRRLWELAYGQRPVPIAPAQFARVAAVVQTVRAALADGTLRFQEPAHSR
jgi:hypothetical protein